MPRPAFDPPPPELRQFGRLLPGLGLGVDVFASRGEWIRARRAWEITRGQAMSDWLAAAVAEARAERGFDGWAAMGEFRIEADADDGADRWGRDEW